MDAVLLPTAELVQRIRGVRGDFAPGPLEVRFGVARVVGLALSGALFVINGVVYLRLGITANGALSAFVGTFLCVLGIAEYRSQLSVCYRFENGDVAELSRSGRVRWRERLEGLQLATCRENFAHRSITLQWPDHRRRLVLHASLRSAINGMASTPNNALERARGR